MKNPSLLTYILQTPRNTVPQILSYKYGFIPAYISAIFPGASRTFRGRNAHARFKNTEARGIDISVKSTMSLQPVTYTVVYMYVHTLPLLSLSSLSRECRVFRSLPIFPRTSRLCRAFSGTFVLYFRGRSMGNGKLHRREQDWWCGRINKTLTMRTFDCVSAEFCSSKSVRALLSLVDDLLVMVPNKKICVSRLFPSSQILYLHIKCTGYI